MSTEICNLHTPGNNSREAEDVHKMHLKLKGSPLVKTFPELAWR